jgi:RNA polymerase sigma-70 factor (ECF subfamily)
VLPRNASDPPMICRDRLQPFGVLVGVVGVRLMRATAMDTNGKVDMAIADSFSEFYEQSYGLLVGQVFVVTTDRVEAEEAVQEAFARLWSRWSRVSRYENPEAWVRRVALNIAMKRWRRARQGDQLAKDAYADAYADTGLVSEAATTGDRLDLVAGLRRLPSSHRQALLLYYIVGLSVQEVANEMSTRLSPVAPGTVKSWLHRGRAELGNALSNEENSDV